MQSELLYNYISMASKQKTNSTEAIRSLKAQLEAGQFAPVYLVMGDQDYLRTQSRDMIRNALLPGADAMNSAYLTGEHIDAQEILSLAETMPFFAERRVITIENSGWFDKGGAQADTMTEYLPSLPETTHLLFVENKVDKTRRLYKAVQRQGTVLDCATPLPEDLERWVLAQFRKAGIVPTADAFRLFMDNVGDDLLNIKSEIDKVTSYCMEKGSISREDVAAVCTPEIKERIFDMISEITAHHTEQALSIYMDVRKMQTPPQVILALMIRNYNQLLQVGELDARGMSADEIASAVHANPWALRKRILPEARQYSAQEMREALQDCIQMDQDYKSGRIGDQLGVETLIVRRSALA